MEIGAVSGLADIVTVNLDHYRLDVDQTKCMTFFSPPPPTVWVSVFDKPSTLRLGSSWAATSFRDVPPIRKALFRDQIVACGGCRLSALLGPCPKAVARAKLTQAFRFTRLSPMNPFCILIPGMFSCAEHLQPLKLALNGLGFDVAVVDLPYHRPGLSQIERRDLGHLGLNDYADHVAREIQSQMAARKTSRLPILCGHSMGGLIALKLAARNLASAAVLLTPAPPATQLLLPWSMYFAFLGSVTACLALKKAIMPIALRWAMLNGLPPAVQDEVLASLVLESSQAAREIAFHWFPWMPDPTPAAVERSAVSCPLLFCGATRDRTTPPTTVNRAAGIFGADYLEFDAAHWIMRSAAWPEVVQAMGAWLKQRFP